MNVLLQERYSWPDRAILPLLAMRAATEAEWAIHHNKAAKAPRVQRGSQAEAKSSPVSSQGAESEDRL